MTAKSAILKALVAMNETTAENPPSKQVLVLDAMAQLQQFTVGTAKIFHELVVAFLGHLAKMSAGYSVVHLIFDRYDVGSSLKDRTRTLRTKGGCELEIKDSTRIPTGMSMNRILSTSNNKNAIIALIVERSMHFSWDMHLVCSWNDQVSAAQATELSHPNYKCAHEEADTKIVYCLSRLLQDDDVMVVSPDTDVLILLIRHFEKIPSRTRLRLGKYTFNISVIHEKLGHRADALTSFHALTGCDTVESFFRKGKLQTWSAFLKADEATILALLAL